MVYAVILSRHCLIETKEEDYGCLDDRRRISYEDFMRYTGLARASVWNALNWLSCSPALIEPFGPDYPGLQEPYWYDLIVTAGTPLYQVLRKR